tara:strand:+ start:1134 stop:1874 length:741 start_codon:yes stop_codon:yes gene_type:complete
MKILAIIPARMGSTRFPGKPMQKIGDKPMIGHVLDRVRQSNILTETIVATCDEEIFDYISSINGTAIMTKDSHERASDRCAEALLKQEELVGYKYDIIVMVQGDEPMTHPDMISEAIQPMIEDQNIMVTNLIAQIEKEDEFLDPNCIKVVCDVFSDALYFSRQAIPSYNQKLKTFLGKQVCVIPFRRDFLLEYNSMEPTPLEIAESVDMMRVLEHGFKVRMIPTHHKTHAVDTPEDLEKVTQLILS